VVYIHYFEMELYTALCALVVSSVFRRALTCKGKMRIGIGHLSMSRSVLSFVGFFTNRKDISEVLAGIQDWKGLADLMNINSLTSRLNCAPDIAHAVCYRWQIVRSCCNRQLSGNLYKVVEDIAQALEQMDHNHQAAQLRKLEFGKLVANHPYHHISNLSPIPSYQNIGLSKMDTKKGCVNEWGKQCDSFSWHITRFVFKHSM